MIPLFSRLVWLDSSDTLEIRKPAQFNDLRAFCCPVTSEEIRLKPGQLGGNTPKNQPCCPNAPYRIRTKLRKEEACKA